MFNPVVSRDEWLNARLELLDREKELTRLSDEVARRRQELPRVKVDKAYRFDTDEGPASLNDLFGGRSQLLVYHFMFGPDYTAGCPSCSSIADEFNGVVVHLANHDVTLWTGLGLSLSTATYLRWVLLFLCVASLLFLIVRRLDRIGAIFRYFKKETEPCNTKL